MRWRNYGNSDDNDQGRRNPEILQSVLASQCKHFSGTGHGRPVFRHIRHLFREATMTEPTIDQLQAQIRNLEQQLFAAQRSATLGQLCGTTTHEFNNVLMTVINYARMGMRHKDEPTRDKAFARILAAGERAAKITNSVLGMARNRSDDFAPVNLEELISETLFLLERELQKYRVSVEYEPGGVPPVHAIGNQIQQVFMNLVINARQAMKDGGRLVIRTSRDAESGMIDLMVRDYGCGIAADKLQKIFDSGFTTKSGPDESGRGGNGLGLHTCLRIIETHGGKIRVESSPGVGTCFTVRLRPAEHIARSAIPAVAVDQQAPSAGITSSN
jgi:signal transduction histidine kinase